MNNLYTLLNRVNVTKSANTQQQGPTLDQAMEAVNTYMNKVASVNSNPLVTSGIVGVSNYVNYQNNN